MYNRYVPQSDGSYRKNRVPEQGPVPPRQHIQQPRPSSPPLPPADSVPSLPPCEQSMPAPVSAARADGSVMGFLRQLLPKDFDTGDLLVVVLLLLMASDSAEEQNSALLTLALYFFM